MKNLCLLLIAAASGFAQTGGGPASCITTKNCYIAYKETALTSATEAITIQAGKTLNIYPQSAVVYCSAATDITFAVNGTAATSTTLAETALNGAPAAQGTAYSASNVGSGTTVEKISILTGGGTFIEDLTKLVLYNTPGGTQNLTVSTSSTTATCRFKILFIETTN